MESESRPIIQACYINGKTCRNGKRDDFDVNALTGEKFICNKWVKLIGSDPQTDAPIETWCCSEFAKIKLLLENSHMTRMVSAEINEVRKETAKQKYIILNDALAEPQNLLPPLATDNGDSRGPDGPADGNRR